MIQYNIQQKEINKEITMSMQINTCCMCTRNTHTHNFKLHQVKKKHINRFKYHKLFTFFLTSLVHVLNILCMQCVRFHITVKYNTAKTFQSLRLPLFFYNNSPLSISTTLSPQFVRFFFLPVYAFQHSNHRTFRSTENTQKLKKKL